MKLIHNIADVTAPAPTPALWTAIIPAAGRGSRLQVDGPKVLYPVLGKPILNWLVELIEPLCKELVIVASPEGAPLIQPRLEILKDRVRMVIQAAPTGMGDAIALCEASVKTPYALVIWGDQITPRTRTLAACMGLLESSPAVHAVIPTMERTQPYIHFRRGPDERVMDVFQARESEQRVPRGESDCGVFCFQTEALFSVLRRTRGDQAHRGAKTQENNFLSLLPMFHNESGSLVSVRLDDASETVGINTEEDARQVSQILAGRDLERKR